MKKILSVLLMMTMLVSVMLIAPAATADAATNSATAFHDSEFLRVGNYYFSKVFLREDSKTVIYRTKSNGTGTVRIASGLMASDLFSYKTNVYFKMDNYIYRYSSKTLKASKIKKVGNDYDLVGITTYGLIISSTSNNTLYLLKTNGKTKRISSSGSRFLAATASSVFYTKCLDHYKGNTYYYEKLRVYQYALKSGKTASRSTFTSYGSSYNNPYAAAQDAHVFKSSIVFTCGVIEGSAAVFHGSVYSMTTGGTKIKKLFDTETKVLTPGKNCVYGKKFVSGSTGVICKINGNGAVAKTVKNGKIIQTTANNYSALSVTSGGNQDLYVNSAVSTGKGKRVFRSSKFIYSGDPSDATAYVTAPGSVGNVILVTVDVHSYQDYSYGWRGRTVRTKVMLVNTKTRKVYPMN